MAPKTPRTPQTPSSKVTARVDWKQCASCASTFVLRDSLRHEAVCSIIASQELLLADINHGFVIDKRLCGVLEEKACKDCLQHVQKLQKCHVVLVSPSAMQLCGVEIGSHVEVKSFNKKSSIFVAWPCYHIAPSAIFIEPEGTQFIYPRVNCLQHHFKHSSNSFEAFDYGPAEESLFVCH